MTSGPRSAGRARCARGHLMSPGWPLPPLHLRRTAGGRPCITPGTARPRLAAVTPADRDRAGTAILLALQP